jgi:hypothetical protein
MRSLLPIALAITLVQIAGCASAPASTVTLVGQTLGVGAAGYDEIGRMKSSSLREKLLREIDTGKFGVNDYVPIDLSQPEVKITALCAATRQGNVRTIEELLKRGARVNQTCGMTGKRFPLDLMIEQERKYTFYYDETIAVLTANGAQVNKPENQARLDQHFAELRAEAAQKAEARKQLISNLQTAATIVGTVAVAKANAGKTAYISNQNLAASANSVPNTPTTTQGNNAARQNAQPATVIAGNESWRACGPKKTCLVGDGMANFCSGPYDPSKPMCKSECSMSSGVFYHDTTLAPGSYVPGNGKCPTGSCNVINEC